MFKIDRIHIIDEDNLKTGTVKFDWTAKVPVITGFYFYKYENSNDVTIIDVTVTDVKDLTKPRFAYFLGNSLRFDILDLSGTFYGPLPLP